jgi:hypothetical protein
LILLILLALSKGYLNAYFDIFLWVLLSSNFNNNTEPFYKRPTILVEERLTPQEAFEEWVVKKWNLWKSLDSTGKRDSMPVYFIATQGGGIRGVHWTTGIFHYLDSLSNGEFYKQTFCVSGVSGGGVGAAFYNTFYYDLVKSLDTSFSYRNLKEFTKYDFLSSVTASFGFSDNLQRFLPFPVKSLDRSKMLALNWEVRYKDAFNIDSPSIDQDFLKFWYNSKKEFNYSLPSLLINGTLAENGQKVITSNLKLEGKFFKDDLDFYCCTGKDISMAAAILNCCRFPYLTSGGLLKKDGCNKGHIVDGGYRENSGLQSLINLYYTLLPQIVKPSDSTIKIKPVILYLKNGGDELDKEAQATRFLHDFLTPINALASINGTALPSKGIEAMSSQIVEQSHVATGAEYFTLWLEDRADKSIKLPLGWYISKTVINEIENRVFDLPLRDTGFVNLFRRIHL